MIKKILSRAQKAVFISEGKKVKYMNGKGLQEKAKRGILHV